MMHDRVTGGASCAASNLRLLVQGVQGAWAQTLLSQLATH